MLYSFPPGVSCRCINIASMPRDVTHTDKHDGTHELNETKRHVGNVTLKVTNTSWPQFCSDSYSGQHRHAELAVDRAGHWFLFVGVFTVYRGGAYEDYCDTV
jgi:hypothetical protein